VPEFPVASVVIQHRWVIDPSVFRNFRQGLQISFTSFAKMRVCAFQMNKALLFLFNKLEFPVGSIRIVEKVGSQVFVMFGLHSFLLLFFQSSLPRVMPDLIIAARLARLTRPAALALLHFAVCFDVECDVMMKVATDAVDCSVLGVLHERLSPVTTLHTCKILSLVTESRA
jgi:hypothetical protein